MRISVTLVSIGLVGGLVAAAPSNAQTATTATPKAGAKCAKVGTRVGSFVCQSKAGKLVWVSAPAASTPSTAASRTKGSSPTSPGSAATAPQGIEGTWKPTEASAVGYRAKEVLQGLATEGAGRTNAVTGKLIVAANKVTVVDLTVDMTTLKSDSVRRDQSVRETVLDTARYPTATLKLLEPIDLGATVPGDKVEINKKAKVQLTIRGTTKTVELDLKARRNGPNLEVEGAYNVVFGEWNIGDPSVPEIGINVEPNALLEFLVVFGR